MQQACQVKLRALEMLMGIAGHQGNIDVIKVMSSTPLAD
jgi:hypothetical protein